nr:LrgA-associated membrane protein LrgB [Kibdelosporangium sp. MJ126-NF4]CTQ93608.1 LrgA-associated membrane protein LrgB [Kibdelosporangium sp. MJ126-NF4]
MVMNAAIHAVLSTAAESDAGAVSGVQQAANQIGGLLGTSVLGAVLASTATGRFADATGVAELDAATARAVSQGIAPIPPGADAQAAAAVTRAANEAFLSGIHTLMWICAGLALASCVFATKIHPLGRVPTTPNAGSEE